MKKQKPSILIATDGLFPGGRERQIIELLKGLHHSKQFRVVLTVQNSTEQNSAGTLIDEARCYVDSFFPFYRRWKLDITPEFMFLKRVRTFDIQLIHTLGFVSDIIGLFAARSLRVPIINGSIRNAPPYLDMRQKISLQCGLHSDIIISNSYAGAKSYGLEANSRVRVIYNGIDFSRFNGLVHNSSDEKSLCMVANFSKRKDHVSVVRALPLIHQEFPQTKLVLVGRDLGTLKEITHLVSSMNLERHVVFIRNTDNPQAYIAGSSVCILASTQNEGLSNAILEYMALSKPVVATACDGNAEVVCNKKTGFLAAAYSPEAIAKYTITLLQNPDLAREMGDEGRLRVIKHFALSRMIQDYISLYYSLLS